MAAHDQGYVGAPPAAVYGLLGNLEGYRAWWPDAAGPTELALDGFGRLSAVPGRFREDLGLFLDLSGGAAGTLEWHLEPFEEGTVVNAILNLDVSAGRRRASRRLLAARGSIRRGMVGLKRALEPTGGGP